MTIDLVFKLRTRQYTTFTTAASGGGRRSIISIVIVIIIETKFNLVSPSVL